MRRFIFAVPLLLVACVPDTFDFETPYTCDVSVFGKIGFEYAADCEAARHNVELVVGAFLQARDGEGNRVVRDLEEVQAIFRPVPVRISQLENLEFEGELLGGMYHPMAGIALSRDMWSLAHEMAHHLNLYRNKLGGSGHCAWTEKGYNALIHAYQENAVSPSAEPLSFVRAAHVVMDCD